MYKDRLFSQCPWRGSAIEPCLLDVLYETNPYKQVMSSVSASVPGEDTSPQTLNILRKQPLHKIFTKGINKAFIIINTCFITFITSIVVFCTIFWTCSVLMFFYVIFTLFLGHLTLSCSTSSTLKQPVHPFYVLD